MLCTCSFIKSWDVLVSVHGVVCQVFDVRAPSPSCKQELEKLALLSVVTVVAVLAGKCASAGAGEDATKQSVHALCNSDFRDFAGNGVLQCFVVQVSLSYFTFFRSFC